MGRCASATVAYGVDLGNPEYGEWNFELADGVYLNAPEWEDLLTEFAGWDETELPYGDREYAPYEHEAYSAQRARRWAALAAVGIEQDHYGYEYSGIYLRVGERHRVDIDCEPLGFLKSPDYPDVVRLQDFIEFLDTKGLVLKSEHREPHWLLMATYG